MTDLVEFLRARLDEDKAIAREGLAPDGSRWRVAGRGGVIEVNEHGSVGDWVAQPEQANAEFIEQHIAAWDPSRVLADVAAKRAVLELHPTTIYTDSEPGFRMILTECTCASVLIGKESCCRTLLALVQPYADHPGFDPAWREAPHA